MAIAAATRYDAHKERQYNRRHHIIHMCVRSICNLYWKIIIKNVTWCCLSLFSHFYLEQGQSRTAKRSAAELLRRHGRQHTHQDWTGPPFRRGDASVHAFHTGGGEVLPLCSHGACVRYDPACAMNQPAQQRHSFTAVIHRALMLVQGGLMCNKRGVLVVVGEYTRAQPA